MWFIKFCWISWNFGWKFVNSISSEIHRTVVIYSLGKFQANLFHEKDIISHFLPTNNNLKPQTIKRCAHCTTWSSLTTPGEVTFSGRGSLWNRKSKEEHATLATFSFRRISRTLLVSAEFHFPLCSPRNRIVHVFKHWQHVSLTLPRWIEPFLTYFPDTCIYVLKWSQAAQLSYQTFNRKAT